MALQVHDAVKAYLAAASTPVSLAVRKYCEEDRVEDILNLKVSPMTYTNAEQYLYDAQCVAFFKKNASYGDPQVTRAAALDAWYAAEHSCARANAMFSRLRDGPWSSNDLALISFLERVKRRMSWWLGPVPNSLLGRFGPGVTVGTRGNPSTVPDKMSIIPTATPGMLPYLHWWEQSAWARALSERGLLYAGGTLNIKYTREGSWSSVRKNALTDRSIEIGPDLNVYHQLFVGQTMKRRFSARGWDLRRQADLHKQVACAASISGNFATLDLKRASDSMCRGLVRFCTPAPWLQLMEDLRVPRMRMPDNRVVYLEKFSGMGNGYTFELESLLFLAVSQEVLAGLGLPSTANTDVFVFGDDIIVPTCAAACVTQALRVLGFELNDEKSFSSGPFRESCGGDYFEGKAVRPHYLEENPSEPQHYIAWANGLRRVAFSHDDGFLSRDYLLKPWLRVLDAIPTAIRECRGPEELGDLLIHDEAARWGHRVRNSRRFFRCYRPVTRKVTERRGGKIVSWAEFHQSTQLATRLLFIGDDLGVTPRDAVDGFKLGWVQRS